MIEINRTKFIFKIIEQRYPDSLIFPKEQCNLLKIYSFNKLNIQNSTETKTNTMYIDLTKTEDELWQNMKQNYRKHIKTEENKLITVLLTNKADDFNYFYNKIYIDLCKFRKLKPYPKNYLKQGDLWIAKDNSGKIVSGSIIYNDDKFATQSFTASDKIEYNGNRLLIWTAIKHYKAKGLSHFYFGGGFSDYKSRFGSTEKEVYLYSIPISNPVKLIFKLRKLL